MPCACSSPIYLLVAHHPGLFLPASTCPFWRLLPVSVHVYVRKSEVCASIPCLVSQVESSEQIGSSKEIEVYPFSEGTCFLLKVLERVCIVQDTRNGSVKLRVSSAFLAKSYVFLLMGSWGLTFSLRMFT